MESGSQIAWEFSAAGSNALTVPHSSLAPLGDMLPANSSGDNDQETPEPDECSAREPIVPIISVACLPCRTKHLKCDGKTPCSRCKTYELECSYIASRRGHKGSRRNTVLKPALQRPNAKSRFSTGSTPGRTIRGANSTTNPEELASMGPMSMTLSLVDEANISRNRAAPELSHESNSLQLCHAPYLNCVGGILSDKFNILQPASSTTDQFIDAYYFYFYPGHPSVLPKEYLQIASGERKLDHLLAAMRWAGSFYLDVGPARVTLFEEAVRLCYTNAPKDGFLVQAMIILVVCLDGNYQQDKARDVLKDVERIAIEIGLYKGTFATHKGEGNPRIEESWRRTWWDLFTVDGMVAGIHQKTDFPLFDIVSDVALPCEEHEYVSGVIPHPMQLEEFDDQLFSLEEKDFSSFAYRIAAMRNLGRLMRLPETVFPDDERMLQAESYLSAWHLQLPPLKRHNLDKECQFDEMMFQAHMVTHACTIMLHQRHSQLDFSPTRHVTTCAPHQLFPSNETFNTHTQHVISAACEISRMVTYSVPITSHTPFFTCVLTLSSTVHLSKWALYLKGDEDDLRQQIRLNICALNKMSMIWRTAKSALQQVKGVAQEIYRAKTTQQSNSGFWAVYTQEESMATASADESIMSEIDTMLT